MRITWDEELHDDDHAHLYHDGMQRVVNQEPGRAHDVVKTLSEVRTGKFATAEEAARAWDDAHLDEPGVTELNFSGHQSNVGLHVLDSITSLCGDDGTSVIGVQAGVPTQMRMSIKMFDRLVNYLEIDLSKAEKLPRMDAGCVCVYVCVCVCVRA